jgi:hypothetical protein
MSFILSGIVRATGSVVPPLIFMVISLWIIRIPFAMSLQPTLGADAIWWSFPLGSIASLILAAGWFKWGPWRKSRLLETIPRGEVPDTGHGAPGGIEETEVAEAAR